MKNVQIKPSRSVYAEEVMVINTIKAEKENDEVKKQGFVRLTFIDTISGEAVADVTISSITAKALRKILNENLGRLEKDLQSTEMPEVQVTTDSTNYIG